MIDPVTKRPMTMTIVCSHCSNQFGLWRPQCPTCGWAVPSDVHRKAMDPVGTEARERRARSAETREVKRVVRTRTDLCIFCRRPARDRKRHTTFCPHCQERIHDQCLRLHHEACADFQIGREDALKKLGMKENQR